LEPSQYEIRFHFSSSEITGQEEGEMHSKNTTDLERMYKQKETLEFEIRKATAALVEVLNTDAWELVDRLTKKARRWEEDLSDLKSKIAALESS
jgi:hypothetical protein